MNFKAGLKSREFMVTLAKSPPQMTMEMLLKAIKYMNSENALAAIRDKEKPREREGKGEDQRGRKREKGDHQVPTEINERTIKLLGR